MINAIGYLFGTVLCLVFIGIIGVLIFAIVCGIVYAKGKITGKENAITKWIDDDC